MKVLMLMLSDNPGIGGLEKHTRELAMTLDAQGVQLAVAAAAQHLTDLPASIETFQVDTRKSRNSPGLLLKLLHDIRAGHFDIVHAQGTKAAYVLQRLAPLIRSTGRVATIHGFKSRYPKASAFHRLIAVSQTLADDIGQTGVAVVYNGISIEPPAPASLPPELKRPIWLAAGRLVPVKGFEFLIQAFKQCNGSLLIAGDGPEKDRLQQIITATNQSDTVKLLGFRSDITALMAAADGVVISSEREGFSYVCAEALLMSKPIVSTNVPIANEFLPPAHICRDKAPEVFARYLNRAPSELDAEQAEAREAAASTLTLHAMTKQTLDIYREVSSHGH